MKKLLVYPLLLLLVSATMAGCSKKEEEQEKGAINKMTDKAADEITTRIKTPLNKARAAHDLQAADRDAAIDEATSR